MATIHVDPDELKDLVAQVVRETLAQLDADGARLPADRLAYSEDEAAAMLGLNVHQLRGERHKGRIEGSVIVGRRVRYTRADLLGYLARERIGGATARNGHAASPKARRGV